MLGITYFLTLTWTSKLGFLMCSSILCCPTTCGVVVVVVVVLGAHFTQRWILHTTYTNVSVRSGII